MAILPHTAKIISISYKTTRYLLGTLDTKGEYDPSFIDYQAYLCWTPNTKWEIGLIANAAVNNYRFRPTDRNTTFGTAQDPKNFKVYFDGWEKDRFNTLFGALDLKYNEDNTVYRLNFSAFESHESESFDILSQYWLDEAESNGNLAVGSFMQHARNRLKSQVLTASFKVSHHPASTRATSSSSMKFTAFHVRSRSTSIPRWRTSSSTSWWTPAWRRALCA